MIFIEKTKPLTKNIEMVERKGLGHPDSICDSVADEFSINLCKEYLKRFGVILHHNVDKLDLVGGQAEPKFNGGRITKPLLLFFSGRATSKVENNEIPLKEIAVKSAKNWIKNNLRFLNPENHVKYLVETKSGAGNLKDVYKRKESFMGANDTSVGIAHAPLSRTEELVLKVEKELNNLKFKKEFPYSGEDIKILGYRIKNKTSLIISMGFVDKFIKSIKDYSEKKELMIKEVKRIAGSKVNVVLNSMDDLKRGINGCYFTVTGTSAEHGDDGAVGRGNRVNGLITPCRPGSYEAASGKNPVNHVGKIYNILALKTAKRLVKEVNGLESVNIKFLSRVGVPINKPELSACQVALKKSVTLNEVKNQINDIISSEVLRIKNITKEVVNGRWKSN